MKTIAINTLLQLLFVVGIICVFGLAVRLLSGWFYNAVGNHGRTVCLVTGFIGTPVHELGHAFFCIVFGHKITGMKLYQPDNETMGYVHHTYNRRNVYHQIGLFFIGMGPIIFGSGALLLLMRFLAPDVLGGLGKVLAVRELDFFSFAALSSVGKMAWGVFKTIFAFENMAKPLWWVFIILAFSVAVHMDVSIPDIKSSSIGLVYIAALFAIANTVLYYVSAGLMHSLTAWCLKIGILVLNFLMPPIVLLAVLLALALLIKGIRVNLRKI